VDPLLCIGRKYFTLDDRPFCSTFVIDFFPLLSPCSEQP